MNRLLVRMVAIFCTLCAGSAAAQSWTEAFRDREDGTTYLGAGVRYGQRMALTR